MSDVLVQRPKEFTLPIVHTAFDEEEDYPDPPDKPIEPIHALQRFFLPYLLGYLFISVIIAITGEYYILLGISGLSIIALIVGRILEKKYKKDPIFRRIIAIRVLVVEVMLFLIWQISCIYLIG